MPGATAPLLRLDGVTKRFSGLLVVDDVDLEVASGEALGVVGPNGAGKTTLLNLIGGDLPPSAGTVHLAGVDVTRASAHVRCRAGVGRTYQIPRPFGGMTVFENVMVAATHGRGRHDRAASDAAVRALDRARLVDRANVPAGRLGLLELKRLELARALATEPRIILLDEIAGGLTEPEVERLVPTLRELADAGVAVVWIEHVVQALLAVVTRLVAVASGAVFAEGEPATVMASDAVRELYLGTTLELEAADAFAAGVVRAP